MEKITPYKKGLLRQMGLTSFNDVIKYFPRRYEDTSLDLYLSSYNDKKDVTIECEVVEEVTTLHIRKGLSKLTFKVEYNGEVYNVVCFNRNYISNILHRSSKIILQGKFNFRRKEITLTNIIFDVAKKNQLIPVYNTVAKLSSNEFAKIAKYSYEILENRGLLEDFIPEVFREKYKLISRKTAYYYRHFPTSQNDLKEADRYFKYEELLIYALTILYNRKIVKENGSGISKNVDLAKVNEFTLRLPYSLTEDQKSVIEEIIADLKSPSNMYRLLQGDVGTGKTIVSTTSLVAVASCGYQGAMMAPTDILARQHYKTIKQMIGNLPYKVALLVAGMTSKEKNAVKKELKEGNIDIIVGTHALISDDVEFNKLGLVVIDEQHRFGVVQRNKLRKKGTNVDFLLMSATPIPRTMALSIYGDMDISTLHTFPNGPRRITTLLYETNEFGKVLSSLDDRLASGSKMYVICPLISDKAESVESIYKRLEKYYEGRGKVLYVHGKMSSEEKDKIIEEFNNDKKAKVLVSTTVIEVGIDVKEADIMMILGAERFGLAQIHQLRGRIGRAGQEGICVLFTSEPEEAERLSFMCNCNDGFEISAYDLKHRGPGDIIGTSQSGMVDLHFASLVDDYRILEVAREDAKYILNHKDEAAFSKIIKIMMESYQGNALLID